MARTDFIFGEKVHFSFRNHIAEFAVKKMKKDHGATRDFGKIVWQVTKADIPGIALKVGDILELQPGTLPVAQAVRPAPPKVPPPVPLQKPKVEQSFSDIKPGA